MDKAKSLKSLNSDPPSYILKLCNLCLLALHGFDDEAGMLAVNSVHRDLAFFF